MSVNEAEPLLRNRRQFDATCTTVGDNGDIDVTLFDRRRPSSVTKRIVRLYRLESEVAASESDDTPAHRLKCLCTNQMISHRLRNIRDKGNELIRGIVLPTVSRWSTKTRIFIQVLSLLLGLVSLSLAVVTTVKHLNNILARIRIGIAGCTIILSALHLLITGLQSRKRANRVQSTCDSANGSITCWQKLKTTLLSLSTWELSCTLLKEAFEYPIVVCNIIEKATNYSNSFSTEKEAYFGFSLFKLAFEVYFIRFFVLCSSIHSLRKLRKGTAFGLSNNIHVARNSEDDTEVYTVATTHGLTLEIVFCCHVILQMICQIFILAALWVKIQCENFVLRGQLHISVHSWILIVAGFVIPILGTFAFYIPLSRNIQLYPVEFVVDVLGSLRKCGLSSITETAHKNLKKLHKSMIAAVKQEREDDSTIFKLITSPLLIILSAGYLGPLLVTCYIGIADGKEFHINGSILSCDVTPWMLQGLNDSGSKVELEFSRHISVWSGINIAAVVVLFLSNGLVLLVSTYSALFIALCIVLLPVILPLSIVVYYVSRCCCPKCYDDFPDSEDCSIFVCLSYLFIAFIALCAEILKDRSPNFINI